MIRTRIIYATKTKHSKKLAEAIGLALNIKAENVSSQPDLLDTDLLFIVSGIYGGESMPELIEYVKKLNPTKVKSVALVTNCGSGKQKQVTLRKTLEDNGIRVIDEFVCQGAILVVSLGHPNTDDITAAVGFAESIIKRLNN